MAIAAFPLWLREAYERSAALAEERMKASAMLVVLLGKAEADRVLATAPSLPGGELEVARRVLAGYTLDAAGTWLPPRPSPIEELQRMLATITRPPCST
jgi:hypothetical protein